MLFESIRPWLALLLLITGLLALGVELFLPGFGVAGTLGLLLVVWGVLLLTLNVVVTTSAFAVALAVTVLLFIFLMLLFNRIQLWQKFSLFTRQQREAGYTAPREGKIELVGKIGVTVTPLHPAGKAEIEGQRYDVISRGEYIAAGVPVRVVRVEGVAIVVTEARE